MSEPTCLFCKIVRGELKAERVAESDSWVAFRDIDPRAPVHVLVVPREHVASLNDLEERHAEVVGKLHLAARDVALREGLADSGWRVVTNVGADAGQTVAHLHLHVLGGRRLAWPPG